MFAPKELVNPLPAVSDKFIDTSEAINNLDPLAILSVKLFIVPPNVFDAQVPISDAVNGEYPLPL